MSTATKLRPGTRVRVLWGFDEPRSATVIEVWGDPAAPSQVRVELDGLDGEDESALLLLSPAALIDAA
jgi:hypothetical protein